MIAPAIEQIAAERAGSVRVGNVNVDEQPELADLADVQGIPIVVLYRGGRPATKRRRRPAQTRARTGARTRRARATPREAHSLYSAPRAEQTGIRYQERHHEVQARPHPSPRTGVTAEDHRALVDQRQHNADNDRDPDRPA